MAIENQTGEADTGSGNDAAKRLMARLDDPFNRVLDSSLDTTSVGDVNSKKLCDRVAAEFSGNRLTILLVAVEKGDIGAIVDEVLGEGAAQARGAVIRDR